MKKLLIPLMAIALLAGCGGTGEKAEQGEKKAVAVAQEPTDGEVMVYYFHGRQRCKSCVSIQNVAQEAVEENYADNSSVKFVEVNFAEFANQALADKYEVAFSSLIIATSGEFTDLTNEGFASAMSNPDALKELIVEVVDGYL